MGEFRYVWVNTRLIVLTALSAALYAVILVPFKIGLVFIPGVTEWRPANAIPIVCSLLFGPAAAWGTAFGNLIGDMFGTLGPGSIGGFVGNFLYGFLPYATWRAIAGTKPQLRSLWDLLLYVLVALTASAACAFVIAWWVDLVRVAPFAPVSIIILVNNFAMAVLLGPPLLFILQPAVATWQLTYERINPEIAVRHPVRYIIGWALIAIACAIGIALRRMPALEGTFLSQHFGLVGATAPLLIMVIIGAVLLTNRIRMPVRVAPLMEVTPSAGELAWQVSHLSFAYPGSDSHALRDINLVQHWGETIIVMGASGAGKSTLCKCLTGIIPHVQPGDCVGEVKVMGRSVTESSVSSLSQHIGLVLQDFEAQLFSTRVDLEVAFACENASLPRIEIGQRVQRALQGVGLSGLEARAPATLSGGQKQRLAI
ncbi:MAG TPA: ATP-binding cassette domain-containing protein, partial [Armatimonadetes bacterium]|nr:ATP-binding cassette domain-containing protein [Armatimonadota bacterium]